MENDSNPTPPQSEVKPAQEPSKERGVERTSEELLRSLEENAGVAQREIEILRDRSAEALKQLKVLEDAEVKASAATTSLEQRQGTAAELVQALVNRQAEMDALKLQAQTDSSSVAQVVVQAKAAATEVETWRAQLSVQRAEISTAHAEALRLQAEASAAVGQIKANEQTSITSSTSAQTSQLSAADAASVTQALQVEAGTTATLAKTEFGQIQALFQQAKPIVDEVKTLSESVRASEREAKNQAKTTDVCRAAAANSEQATKVALASVESLEQQIKEAAGRVSAMEILIKQRDDELKGWQQQYAELHKKIDGLLPGATSAGLATAFREQKLSYTKPKRLYGVLFFASAVILAVGQFFKPEEAWMKNITNPWEGIFADLVHKGPFYVPALMLAYFAFRAFTVADKIEQDYAYKERMATAFEGFKSQLGSIPAELGFESPISVLCSKMLVIIGEHPTRFFDAKFREDLPIGKNALEQINRAAGAAAKRLNLDKAVEGSVEQATKAPEDVLP